MRIIGVKKCSPEDCPYCIPDDTNKKYNWCNAYTNQQRISARIKTFPEICPLGGLIHQRDEYIG